MSFDLSAETSQKIRELLLSGQKIYAIKLFRESTRVGLAEAKAAVDHMESELGFGAPVSIRANTKAPAALGCLIVLSSAVAGVLAAMTLWHSRHGDLASQQRFNWALGIALLVLSTVTTCVQFQYSRRRVLAHAGLLVTFALMATMIYRALYR